MKGIREVSWKSAKGMMSEANFLKMLKELDVDNIGQRQIGTIKGIRVAEEYCFPDPLEKRSSCYETILFAQQGCQPQ